ncbi:hypothetical protein [Cognatishimia sp. MH4019]|uniref:hypothetical protein n=1 Tax=Cognatishimia sp. MH4019 TaxID=2854030 RepID=UPI001CD5C205|nr:hypothetical protein [Cognatishimia sp. MH4019]
MIRVIFFSAIGLLVAALAILLMVRSSDPVQVHLSGDAAAALRAEITLPDGLSYTDDINAARLRVVTFAEWFNLKFVPEAVEQCGTACQSEDAPDLVRVISLRPSGSLKTVLLNAEFLTNLRAEDAPDPQALDCLARIIEAELTTLQAATPPPCADGLMVLKRRELPFGLGYF